MRFLLLFLVTMLCNPLKAEEVQVITRFPPSTSGYQAGFQFIKKLNSTQSKYNFTLRSIPGALGETADQRVLTLARLGTKVVWYNPIGHFTLNRFEVGNTYDRDSDFFFIRSFQTTYQSIVVSKSSNIKNISDLVNHIKNKPKSFYGAPMEVGAIKFLSNIFTKKYNIINAEMIRYKDFSEIVIALNNGEVDYSIFVHPAVTDTLYEIEKSKFNENTIPNFQYETLSSFAVPKELMDFGKELIPLFTSLCGNKEVVSFIEKLKFTETCYDDAFMKQRIKEEVELISKFQ